MNGALVSSNLDACPEKRDYEAYEDEILVTVWIVRYHAITHKSGDLGESRTYRAYARGFRRCLQVAGDIKSTVYGIHAGHLAKMCVMA